MQSLRTWNKTYDTVDRQTVWKVLKLYAENNKDSGSKYGDAVTAARIEEELS